MNVLKMKDIVKGFDGNGVLKGISLEVNKGEVVSVIGPSGSGKSTLLRCATLLEKIDGGEIYYMGEKAVYTENNKVMYSKDIQQIRKCFSLVFQNFNLFPH